MPVRSSICSPMLCALINALIAISIIHNCTTIVTKPKTYNTNFQTIGYPQIDSQQNVAMTGRGVESRMNSTRDEVSNEAD